MANIVISNNGNAQPYIDENGNSQPADPAITYIDANGNHIVIQPATSVGLALPPKLTITGS